MCQLLSTNQCDHGHDVLHDFAETMIIFVIIQNIYDSDIQSAILSHTNQNLSLSELVTFIEAKEAGKISSASLTEAPTTNALKSTYKNDARLNLRQNYRQPLHPRQFSKPPTGVPPFFGNNSRPMHNRNDNRGPNISQDVRKPTPWQGVSQTPRNTAPLDRCAWCGNTGHGNDYRVTVRQALCPAFNKTCSKCGILHHLANACLRRPQRHPNQTSAIEYTDDNQYADDHDQSAEPESYNTPEPFTALSISDSS